MWPFEAEHWNTVWIRRVVKAGRRMVMWKATGPQELLWQRPRHPILLASRCPPGCEKAGRRGPRTVLRSDSSAAFFCRKGGTYLNTKFAASLTLGIFLFFLPFGRSPRLKKVSSGLLGVEGGLILEGDPIPSRLSFLVSSSLKFLLSEFCRKKAGLDNNCCEGKEEKKDK